MLIENKGDIDKALFSEKSLSLLNIRDLRDIGRKFGIPSPTTMKKKELVDEILQIVYGKIEVPVRNNCGRPSVREFDIKKYISKIKNNSDMADEISKMKLDMDYGTMMVSDKTETYEDEDEIEIRVFFTDGQKCFLRKCEFVESIGDIEISKEFAEKFKLENLDVIEILESGGMFKIISINGEKTSSNMPHLRIGEKPVKKGQIQDFYLSTKEEIEKSIEQLSIECEKSETKLLVLAKKEYAGKETSCLVYSDNEDKTSLYKKIITLVNLCKREVLASEDIVIVVETPDEIKNLLEDFDEDVKIRIKKYLEDFVNKIVKLGNIYISLKLEEITLY
jgi:hypothetical protein